MELISASTCNSDDDAANERCTKGAESDCFN